jgi:FkbM family methyltransferase
MNLQIIKGYSRFHEWVHETLKVNVPGIGFLLKTIKEDFEVDFGGKRLFVNHKVIDNYARLINARFNEPETHRFIHQILTQTKGRKTRIIEVGGNIGEFIIDFGDHPSVSNFFVFEPNPDCSFAITRTIQINNFDKVKLNTNVVVDYQGTIGFNLKQWETSSGSICNDSDKAKLPCTTLDAEIKGAADTIMLIDAEGAELRIMKGAKKLILQDKPIIIFEYNHVSRKHFTYEEVQKELGENYTIYRLRNDGTLDKQLKNTWNLVAIHKDESFKPHFHRL